MNKNISLNDILTSTKGQLLSQHQSEFIGVGTDTRQSLDNKVFIALRGDTHDAHLYLQQAVDQKAAALIVHKWNDSFDFIKQKTTVVLVEDTLKALQKLSTHRRHQSSAQFIALTGSNGKTTTKEFLAAILKPYKQVHYNQGSYNNHWGVPLTLLGVQPEHEVVICEMGMNHPGEITDLVHIANPNTVGVTMVGRAHLEGLGSLEAISMAKEEIYCPSNKVNSAVFNLDNPWTSKMLPRFIQNHPNAEVYTFSEYDLENKQNNITVQLGVKSFTVTHIEIEGYISAKYGSCTLEIFGAHNVTNLMAAVCFALASGLSPEQIWKSLPNCKSTWGRNQILKSNQGATIIFDGYNANPDSQKALLENINLITKKPTQKFIGVFGDMKELGEHSCPLHEELGELVATAPFDLVWFVGPHNSFYHKGFSRKNKNQNIKIFSTETIDSEICTFLNQNLNADDLMFIKGSRGMKLELILKELNAHPS